MNTDALLMIGSVNDLVDGSLEVGYTVPHALASDHSIYGRATLFGRPFQDVQLKVERIEGSSQVRVTALDMQMAAYWIRLAEDIKEYSYLGLKEMSVRHAEEAIEYAFKLAKDGPTIIDVIN